MGGYPGEKMPGMPQKFDRPGRKPGFAKGSVRQVAKKVETSRLERQAFQTGLRDGLPICLGYLPVSFAFGMQAAQYGLPVWVPLLISMTNLTSAGQFAGLSILVAGGGYLELAVTTFVINLRYMLMSLSLSQKVSEKMRLSTRCAVAFGVTDEVFAIASQRKEPLDGRYMAGLILTPYLGWSVGTLLGATATSLLPVTVQSALGIMIYGMFLAIIIPPARKSRAVLLAVLIAAAVSCVFRYTPFLQGVSAGWTIIIASVLAAGMCAFAMPIADKPAETDSETNGEAVE